MIFSLCDAHDAPGKAQKQKKLRLAEFFYSYKYVRRKQYRVK